MNQYDFFEEKECLHYQLKELLKKRGDALLEFYLNNGFEALASGLKIVDPSLRQMLFDYLMLERKALLECLRRNKNFFIKMIADGRGESIRPLLGVSAAQYDGVWREALDLLGLYFVEKKVIEKMTNFELEKFFAESIFGKGQVNPSDDAEGKKRAS